MAPSADYAPINGSDKDSNIFGGNPQARSRCLKPLVDTGSLRSYQQRESTPVIGREYFDLQVKELLSSEDDTVFRDLAATSMS